MRQGFLLVATLFLVSGLACPAAVSAQGPEVIRGMKRSTPEPPAQSPARPPAPPETQPGIPPAAPPAGTDVSSQQGLKYLNSGDYDKAVKAFQQALAANPKSPEAYYYLGLAYDAQGDQDKAVKNLQAALRLNSNFPQARVALGHIYNQQGLNLLRQGDPGKAEAVLKQAVAQDAKNDGALNNLGVSLGQQGQLTQSLSSFQKAVAVNPDNIPAQFNLGVSQYALGNKSATVRQYAILTRKDPAAADDLFRLIQGTSQVATPFRF
jgi:tetratricopeptide (TPR) repeat protein